MAEKKKFYAVRKGLTPGIYTSWEECRRNVSGYSGAEYKGFVTREQAEAWIAEVDTAKRQGINAAKPQSLAQGEQQTSDSANPQSPAPAALPESAPAVAYVDGCYHVGTREYSYGAVLFYQGKETHFSAKFADREMALMRNVAGEIEGAMCAMRYCVEHSIPQLELYYDYEGIEKWCTGAWQAKKEGTIAYRAYYKEIQPVLHVCFHKVKGHTGDRYNELADELAKAALGITKKK